MASTTAKRLVVCGGNGFLGTRICKYAVGRGWDVTSISRSGEPQWSSVSSSATAPSWSRAVKWERADLLATPPEYGALLASATAVVHSMGILLEADYKGLVSGRESPGDALRKAFTSNADPAYAAADSSSSPSSSASATARAPHGSATPGNSGSGRTHRKITYECMNRDSAVTLADTAAAAHVPTFVYISAAAGAPVLPKRYISTKREAEDEIARRHPEMRSLFIRAPFMYDTSRLFTVPMAAASGVGSLLNSAMGGMLADYLGAAVIKPLKVEDVALAVVEGIEDQTVQGPVEVPQLETLATRAWRKEML